jgi:hypothetical protein
MIFRVRVMLHPNKGESPSQENSITNNATRKCVNISHDDMNMGKQF